MQSGWSQAYCGHNTGSSANQKPPAGSLDSPDRKSAGLPRTPFWQRANLHRANNRAITTRHGDAPLSTFASTYCARSNSPRSPGKLLSLGDARHACLLSCRLLGRGFGDDTPRAGTRTFKSRGCRGLLLSRLGRAAHGAVGALSAAAKTSTAMVLIL